MAAFFCVIQFLQVFFHKRVTAYNMQSVRRLIKCCRLTPIFTSNMVAKVNESLIPIVCLLTLHANQYKRFIYG